MGQEKLYIEKELSWLAFNERVLQEAADKSNPLIERMRFLGIYSNNLDEIYKVRFAELKRRIIISEEEIQNRVRELGAAISRHYAGKTITLLCILKGGLMFLPYVGLPSGSAGTQATAAPTAKPGETAAPGVTATPTAIPTLAPTTAPTAAD